MMKKILFILHLPPPVHGSSIVGQSIMESELINAQIQGKYINLGTSKSLEEIGKKAALKIGLYFKILYNVLRELFAHKPDLVYMAITSKGFGFYKDCVVAILTKSFGYKVIYHLHNKGVATRQHRWLDNMLYRMVFRKSDVILLSQNLYADIQKYVPIERVHICANGIADYQIKGNITKEKKKGKQVRILFLSNLMEAKGVFVLLKSCRILIEKQLNFHCSFVGGIGDISEEMFLKKVEELGLEKHVSYEGRKYGVEKERSFSEADIFAFPTYNEAFGLVNLEAMQFSLPVVSTLEGGIPDIIEDNVSGLLVNPKDAIAFAEKLEILIKDPKLRISMGENGHKRYKENFTHSAFENRLLDILKKVTNIEKN
jgi:glycosyltransferase involved in cell wall biosynthesis